MFYTFFSFISLNKLNLLIIYIPIILIHYVPRTSGNQPLIAHIFKPNKSHLNVCYDMLRSTYKWKWDFKLREFMQVLPVSAINSADLFPCYVGVHLCTIIVLHFFFNWVITPCKAEQPLQGMELQEKEAQKN